MAIIIEKQALEFEGRQFLTYGAFEAANNNKYNPQTVSHDPFSATGANKSKVRSSSKVTYNDSERVNNNYKESSYQDLESGALLVIFEEVCAVSVCKDVLLS